MFIDLTLEVTPKLTQDAKGNESKACLLYTSPSPRDTR